jgi:tetratricopeptide (TPR) repeat protein
MNVRDNLMSIERTSPDGRWSWDGHTWRCLDSDEHETPDGRWKILGGMFVEHVPSTSILEEESRPSNNASPETSVQPGELIEAVQVETHPDHQHRANEETTATNLHVDGLVSDLLALEDVNITTSSGTTTFEEAVFMGDVVIQQGPTSPDIEQALESVLDRKLSQFFEQLQITTESVPKSLTEEERARVSNAIEYVSKEEAKGAILSKKSALTVANAARAKGDYEEAARRYNDLLQSGEAGEIRPLILTQLGELHAARGSWAESQRHLDTAVSEARSSNNFRLLAFGLVALGNMKRVRKDLVAAESAFRNAFEVAKIHNLAQQFVRAGVNLATVNYELNRLGASRTIFEEVLPHARIVNDISAIRAIETGLQAIDAESNQSSSPHFVKGSTINGTGNSDALTKARAMVTDARSQGERGNLSFAIELYNGAISRFQTLQARPDEARAYQELARLLEDHNTLGESIHAYTRSIECYKSLDDHAAVALVGVDLSGLLLESHRFEEAGRYADRAYAAAQQCADNESRFFACINRIIACSHIGSQTEVDTLRKHAHEIAREFGLNPRDIP